MRRPERATVTKSLRVAAGIPWLAVFVVGVIPLLTDPSWQQAFFGFTLLWLAAVLALPLLIGVTFWKAKSHRVLLLNAAVALVAGLLLLPLVLFTGHLVVLPWIAGAFLSPLLAVAAVSNGAGRRLRIFLLLAVALILGGGFVALRAQLDAIPDVVWELPPGYRGWILVEYDRRECPPLARAGDGVAIQVDMTGRVCTSSAPLAGFYANHYVYLRADGGREPVDEPGVGFQFSSSGVQRSSSGSRKLGTYFFGTRAELDQAWDEEPRLDP